MGYFPFYKGIKVDSYRSGARTRKGQGGDNTKKEAQLKQVKPSASFVSSKDINEDYRPIYDKLLNDYFDYYQSNIKILSDPYHPQYSSIYANTMRMQNGINSFVDFQSEESAVGNKIQGYLQKGEESGEAGDDSWLPDQLEIIDEYANRDNYYSSFTNTDGIQDSLARNSVNKYYFGGGENDESEYTPHRPDIIGNIKVMNPETGLPDEMGEVDINNPDNWAVNENGQFLKNNKPMRSFMENSTLRAGFEPYYNQKTETRYGKVRGHVSNFKDTYGDWQLTPDGRVVVKGYGSGEYQDFRGVNDYKFRRQPGHFLKETPEKNHFALLGDEFWKMKHGGNQLINDEYRAKLKNHINYSLGFHTGKTDDGADIQKNNSVLGNNVRGVLVQEIMKQLNLPEATVNGLETNTYEFGKSEILMDWLDTNKPGMKRRIMKDKGYENHEEIKFNDYVEIETFDRIKDKYLMSYKGMQSDVEAYFNNNTNTNLLLPGDAGYSGLPYYQWDGANLEAKQTGSFIAGTPIHFEEGKTPKINVRLRENTGLIMTGSLGNTVFQEPGSDAYKMLYGLDMTMKKTNVLPILINPTSGQQVSADSYDLFSKTKGALQWREYVSVEMNVSEVMKQLGIIIETSEGSDVSEFKKLYQLLNQNRQTQQTMSAIIPIEQANILTGIFTNDEWSRYKGSKGHKQVINANKRLQ